MWIVIRFSTASPEFRRDTAGLGTRRLVVSESLGWLADVLSSTMVRIVSPAGGARGGEQCEQGSAPADPYRRCRTV